jgi:hypothetical protein
MNRSAMMDFMRASARTPSDFWLRNTSLYFALRANGFAVVQIRSQRI